MSKKMRDRKMKSKPICVLCDRYCKHGGNKRYNVGFTSGTAGYCWKVNKYTASMEECPMGFTIMGYRPAGGDNA